MNKNKTYDMVLASVFIAIIFIMSLVPGLGFLTIMPGVSLVLIHIPVLIGVMILKPRYAFTLGVVFGLGSLIAAYLQGTQITDLAFRNPLISVLPRALFGIAAFYIFQGFNKLSKTKFGKEIIFGIVALITTFAVYYGALALTRTFAQENFETVSSIVVPFALLLSVLLLTLYYKLIKEQKEETLSVPATFITATILHTILVVGALVLFSSEIREAFGTDILGLIYANVSGNGLIEALLAVAIGTPIYLALNKVKRQQY